MKLSTISEWLSWISSIHVSEIDLGLERVKIVAERLHVLSFHCPIVIVGGTNGKGSTVAGLEAIYLAANYQVGAFTSPILYKHNEQVRINGQLLPDALFCEAFAQVANARKEISLTPFEFHTLAALLLFQRYQLDILILEVGLGGRLDAVNILDADVAVVTSIGIDHTEWLGNTREEIAREKAGIFRNNKPAISGDFDTPRSLIKTALDLGTPLYCQGKDFYFKENKNYWSWACGSSQYQNLPLNSLARQNMSTVLMAVHLLQSRLTVSEDAIRQGLETVKLPGRVEIIPGHPMQIFDVSHNPAAIAFLAKRLQEIPSQGKSFAVFSMLKDKDIVESIKSIASHIDVWYVAPLACPRAASLETLQESFRRAEVSKVYFCASIKEAYQLARTNAQALDRVVVFGSFHTVAEVRKE